MYRVLAAASLLSILPSYAHAQDDELDLPDGPGTFDSETMPENPLANKRYRFDGVAPAQRDHRGFDMEFGFRGRWVTIPKSVLDIWYFDIQDDNWAYIDQRPRVKGYALGVEYIVKGESANGIFYAEFLDSEMKEGYWDDYEEPADHLDGDFLAPSPGFGIVAFGANYAYEAHIVRVRDTQNRFGLSFLVGGGLGMGIMTGVMDRWGPDAEGNPAYKRYLDGVPPDEDKRLPRVYPMVDVNAGLRLNFGDRLTFRFEGGLHSLAYFGMSTGVAF